MRPVPRAPRVPRHQQKDVVCSAPHFHIQSHSDSGIAERGRILPEETRRTKCCEYELVYLWRGSGSATEFRSTTKGAENCGWKTKKDRWCMIESLSKFDESDWPKRMNVFVFFNDIISGVGKKKKRGVFIKPSPEFV